MGRMSGLYTAVQRRMINEMLKLAGSGDPAQGEERGDQRCAIGGHPHRMPPMRAAAIRVNN